MVNRKAKKVIKKHEKWKKLSFNKKMKGWLTWHKPFEPSHEVNGSSYCPSCGNAEIKDNGQGFFRCRNEKCGKSFIILKCTEKR